MCEINENDEDNLVPGVPSKTVRGKNARGEQEDMLHLKVSFLACGFSQGTLVSVGDDGYLYIWEDNRILERQKAHNGSIYSLYTENNSEFLVTGALDGTISLWKLQF